LALGLRRAAMPTIALVDDDRNILTSVSIALEAEGYRTPSRPLRSSADFDFSKRDSRRPGLSKN
jgi:FixJ family two-component response regulator